MEQSRIDQIENQFKALAAKLPEDSATRKLINQCDGYEAYKGSASDEIYNGAKGEHAEILDEIMELAQEAQEEWEED